MNLSSHVPTSFSRAKIMIASKSPGILKATVKPESRMRRNSKSDAASSSQALDTEEGQQMQHLCREDTMPREVQIPSLSQDNTVSWVGIVNGVDTYVTESMLTTKEEDMLQ